MAAEYGSRCNSNLQHDDNYISFGFHGPPDKVCGGIKYPSRKLDAINAFANNIERVSDLLSTEEDSLEGNFLNIYNRFCEKPVETFQAIGIEVIGSHSVADIMENEQVFKEVLKYNLEDSTKVLLGLVHKMATTRSTSHHTTYFGNMLCTLFDYCHQDQRKTRITSKLKVTFNQIDSLKDKVEDTPLFQWLFNCMTAHTVETETGELQLDTERFNEKFLQETVYRLLSMEEDEITQEIPLNLVQFRFKNTTDGLICTPQYEYWGKKKKGLKRLKHSKAMPILNGTPAIPISLNTMNSPPPNCNHNEEEVMKVKDLRQIFEQLLAMSVRNRLAFKEDLENKMKRIVVQPGLLVNNDKVRTLVLVMNVKTYKDFCSLNGVENTIEYLKNYAAEATMWCRLYVNFHLVDTSTILQQCREAMNMCGVF